LTLTLTEGVLCIALLGYIYGGQILPLRRPQQFWQHTRQHLSFGLRGVLTGVMTEMNTRIDVIMLGLVSSDALVGLYSFAAILAEGFAQFPIAVRYNVDPRLGQYFAHDDRAEITTFARRVRRYFWPGMLALGIAASLAYPVVFLLISDETGLATSWLVFILLAAGHVLTAGYSPFNGIILIGKLPGWQSGLMLLITLSNIILNLLLIPPLGLFGAAIATSISAIIGTIGLVLVARVRLDVKL
ncbi:MAG: polysaccharide biosynthesis C-terminal domain-containing protein, partial [Anaerolineae bacterium]|nr:polysaccharide biosynthesis C-terminal domain-containing protein [Anaerolineae bacterium]